DEAEFVRPSGQANPSRGSAVQRGSDDRKGGVDGDPLPRVEAVVDESGQNERKYQWLDGLSERLHGAHWVSARQAPPDERSREPASPTIAQTYTSILPRRLIDGRGYVDRRVYRGSPS